MLTWLVADPGSELGYERLGIVGRHQTEIGEDSGLVLSKHSSFC